VTLIALERHPLGPRLHVAARRVHECHVGLAPAGAAVVSVPESASGLLTAAQGVGHSAGSRVPVRMCGAIDAAAMTNAVATSGRTGAYARA
jgi:hypothetical protein